MIHGATLLLLKYKLPYILHDLRHGATLLLLKYKLHYILHDPRCYLTPIKIQTIFSVDHVRYKVVCILIGVR
jgi:hypothetical protein